MPRLKGSTNVLTKKMREVTLKLIEDNAESIQADLEALTPNERLKIIVKLIELNTPKLKEIELNQPQEYPTDITVTIIDKLDKIDS